MADQDQSEQSSSNKTQETNITAVSEQSYELTITSRWIDDYAHISIQPPEGVGIRTPGDICCVIDTSGSMSDNVIIHGAHAKENFGLSQLDIAKHALKTIINSLTQNDRLSIVSFSTTASVVFPLCQMDDDGRSKALAALETLNADGATNLWDGLKTGLNVLTEGQRTSGSNAALFLLTDGQPTQIPPKGHLPALAAYKAKNNFTCSVNTFGFGYNLDSKLLEDLAQMGNSGSYAFIPDGSFVGTIFVNAISNLLTTAATNLQLSIDCIQGFRLVLASGGRNPRRKTHKNRKRLKRKSLKTEIDKEKVSHRLKKNSSGGKSPSFPSLIDNPDCIQPPIDPLSKYICYYSTQASNQKVEI
jgi:uncharacterized protein YegL